MAGPRRIWVSLKSSLWFVPTVCVLFATGLAAGMVEWDSRLKFQLSEHWPSFFGLSAEGPRSILATIADSVITIAGVTFSITIVALSLAANQYTPRVLRNFMRDRGNQFVLGGLVGIFTYCLIAGGPVKLFGQLGKAFPLQAGQNRWCRQAFLRNIPLGPPNIECCADCAVASVRAALIRLGLELTKIAFRPSASRRGLDAGAVHRGNVVCHRPQCRPVDLRGQFARQVSLGKTPAQSPAAKSLL